VFLLIKVYHKINYQDKDKIYRSKKGAKSLFLKY